MLRRGAGSSSSAAAAGATKLEVRVLSREPPVWGSGAACPPALVQEQKVLSRSEQVAATVRALAPVRRRPGGLGSQKKKRSQRARARSSQQVRPAEEHLSYLQRAAVRPRTRQLYLEAWEELQEWCRQAGLSATTEDETEVALLELFDHLYF